MLVSELMQYLEDCDADAEVRLAFQPEWPFEYKAGQVHVPGGEWDDAEIVRDDEGWCIELYGEERDGPFESIELAQQALALNKAEAERHQEQGKVVYISEGGQLGYLSEHTSKALGWGR